jgi:hypothetical protein
MPLRARHLVLLALVACTSERPEGAYTPVYAEAGACKKGFTCPTADAGRVPEGEDAGDEEILDADASEMSEPDAGEIDVDAAANYLARLEGHYLMRVDIYSTLDETRSGTRLALKNRVSNLFLTELTAGEGQLLASEKPCFQSSAHECMDGTCSGWTTAYADGVATEMQKLAPVTRAYTVDRAGNLSAPVAFLALGYRDDVPDRALPTSTADERVWVLDSSEPVTLRGVATILTGSVGSLPLRLQLNCEVDSVQKFATAFKAELGTLDAAGLAARIIEVDTTGTSVPVVIATDDGDPPQLCDKDELNAPGSGGDDMVFVRFKKTTLTACPASASAFESQFKLGADNIDPPTPTDRK